MAAFDAELQEALYEILRGATPALCGGRIYDSPPQADATKDDTAFPFIEIGELQSLPDRTDDDDKGAESFVTLHIWSRYQGKAEIHRIASVLDDLLDGKSIAVAKRASAIAWIDQCLVMNDPDGRTRHGIVTVRVIHRN